MRAPRQSNATTAAGAVAKKVLHHRRGRQQGKGRVQVRHVDELPTSGALPCQQGEENTRDAVQRSAGIIGDEVERNCWRPVGLADQVEYTGDGQEIDVVGRLVPVWTVLPITAERAVNEARADALQRLVVAAKARHNAGPEAFDQHVGVGRELVQQLLAVVLLQIDGDAALVTIDELKSRSPFRLCHLLRRRPRRRFDLHHFSAHVSEHHGAKRARGHADELENFEAFQGTGHGFTNSFWINGQRAVRGCQ